MTSIPVDRTCPYCLVDRGSLREVRFYDFDAVRGTTDREYPIVSGGLLNSRITCGLPECLAAAMRERKAEIEADGNVLPETTR